nr:MAG TPA: hypothetical protein [Caudoviricetes sp.]
MELRGVCCLALFFLRGTLIPVLESKLENAFEKHFLTYID